jgi:hypothetical protein
MCICVSIVCVCLLCVGLYHPHDDVRAFACLCVCVCVCVCVRARILAGVHERFACTCAHASVKRNEPDPGGPAARRERVACRVLFR